MTTLHADGFEDSTIAQMGVEYVVVNSWAWSLATGRRASTSAILMTDIGYMAKVFGGTSSTIFASFALNLARATNDNMYFFRFLEGSTSHVDIAVLATGQIRARNGNGTWLGTTSASVLFVGAWTWIQIKVVIHDTTGSVEIRDASGAVLLNVTSVDTRNAATGYCDSISMGNSSTNEQRGTFDDLHIWDTTGTICNTWTNDSRIDSLVPNGAGAATAFTPSTAPNWSCVNEQPYNTTNYVTSATAAQQDLYTFTDLPHVPLNIFSVVKTAVGQKDDAGARSLKLLTRRSATTYAGTAQTLDLGADKRLVEVLEADPSTSAAWTVANLNAAEFGYENV